MKKTIFALGVIIMININVLGTTIEAHSPGKKDEYDTGSGGGLDFYEYIVETTSTPSPTKKPTKSPTSFPTSRKRKRTPFPTEQPIDRSITVAPTTIIKSTASPTSIKTNTRSYNIQIVFDGMEAKYEAVFNKAKARWESIILGDISSQYVYRRGRTCWGEKWTEKSADIVVDDLLIFANAPRMDGPSGILGSAGFCLYTQESNGKYMPRVGLMSFDSADLSMMDRNGILEIVILHEMGHVLGIGTLWEDLVNTKTFQYTGAGGRKGNELIGRSGNPIVEDRGGSGTALSHWDEDIYDLELMSGYADKGSKLSALTVNSLTDLGYIVDPAMVEPYRVSSRRRFLRGNNNPRNRVPLGDDIIRKTPEEDKSIPYQDGNPIL